MAGPHANYDQVNAITEKAFVPKVVDNIFKSNPLAKRLEKKKELKAGGTKIVQPLNFAQSSAGGWYNGADTLDNTDNETITAVEFEWKQIFEPISISRRDELVNSGTAGVVDFVKTKMKIAEKSLKDKLATGVWNSGTTTNAIIGIRAFLSESNTYGGISQSAQSWHQSNIDAATTTTSIGAVNAEWSNAAVNGENPTVVISGTGRYNNYYSLLQPQQRFMDSESAKGGFTSLMFNGVPWLVDSKAPPTHVVMLNEDYLHLIGHKDEWFRFDPFQKPVNQNAKVAHIFAMLAFLSSNNRMHAALTALTN